MFIVFEGPEGCGKSTQAALASKALEKTGIPIVVTREPGGTPLGEKLRDILLNFKEALDLRAEMLLYMASRAQLVDEVIVPALAEGKTVLCERFLSSTIVYQGIAGGADTKMIMEVGRFATDGVAPDITFVIDLDADAGLRRVGSPDRIESRGSEYHRKVREGFLTLARAEPGTFVVIDGTRSITEIHGDIMKEIGSRMRKSGAHGGKVK